MSVSIRIRTLRLSDYEGMLDLFRVCGLGPRSKGRDSRGATARQLRSKRNMFLGAFDGSRLVGTVLGTHDTRKGWINRLAVDPTTDVAASRADSSARVNAACGRRGSKCSRP